MNKIQDLPTPGPYRTAAEIEKEVKLTRFQKFIDWWKDEDHCTVVTLIILIAGFVGIMIFGFYSTMRSEYAIKKYGITVCQNDHYVKTSNPAVGLKQIHCLTSDGKEKNYFEETNK